MISGGNLRVTLNSRENLQKISEICINEICTLDLSRINLEKKLTILTSSELKEVEQKLKLHLGL
jgi:mRNA interferase MazF